MRINEIANAEEQLGLLRLIIDNTWVAVAQQAEQKRLADAKQAAQARLKPRATAGGNASYSPPPPRKLVIPIKAQPSPELNKAQVDSKTPQPSAKKDNSSKFATKPFPTTANLPTPTSNAAAAIAQVPALNAPIKPKLGAAANNIAAVAQPSQGFNKRSANGIAGANKLPKTV